MKPRLLANENFPAPSVRHLRDRGYDVLAVTENHAGLILPTNGGRLNEGLVKCLKC
jgi:hypothetical protein